MSTKAATKEMCDNIVNSLSWIDSEPETECIKSCCFTFGTGSINFITKQTGSHSIRPVVDLWYDGKYLFCWKVFNFKIKPGEL